MLGCGENQKEAIHPDFNRVIMIDFQGATIFRALWPGLRHNLGQKHMLASAKGKVVLPVWVDVNLQQVINLSPSLAGIYAERIQDGLERVVQDLIWAMSDPAIDSHKLPAAQQSELENKAQESVRKNSSAGLQFKLIDFRYVRDPRGGWWATCSAQKKNLDSALVLMYMSPING